MLVENQPAPDLTARSISGRHIDLSSLRGRKVLIKFHRFAGCPVARCQIDAFMARHGELAKAGVESIIFLHSSERNLAATFHEVPGIHLVSDPSKVHYRRFHSAFRLTALFAPGSWLATFASMLRGYFPIFTRFEGGIFGVPSDFLVDENGVIARVHYGSHFGDTWSAAQAIGHAGRLPGHTLRQFQQKPIDRAPRRVWVKASGFHPKEVFMSGKTEKLVVLLTKGIDSELSSVALTIANGGLTAGLKVFIFLTSTGIDVVRKGGQTMTQVSPLDSLAAMIKDFQARGGVIWACPPCVKSRGYEQADLLDGVVIAGASVMHAEIKDGAATLSF